MTDRFVNLDIRRSESLDVFLAVQRDVFGVIPGDPSYLADPYGDAIGQLLDLMKEWSSGSERWVPAFVASGGRVGEDGWTASFDQRNEARLAPGLMEALGQLREPLDALNPIVQDAIRDLSMVDWHSLISRLMDRFGISGCTENPKVFLVPLAPHYPGSGLLMDAGRPVAGYVDVVRFRSGARLDAVVALVIWQILLQGGGRFLGSLSRSFPRSSPESGNVRSLVLKIIVEITASYETSFLLLSHRGSVDLLGTQWRYPRLNALVGREWLAVLEGHSSTGEAFEAIFGQVSESGPEWFSMEVDAASLAADFYMLEYLASKGLRDAEVMFASWVGPLSAYIYEHVSLVIGGELGHYAEAASDSSTWPRDVRRFAARVNTGDSRAGWHSARLELGDVLALELARKCFDDLGDHYGGAAWGPAAELLGMLAVGAVSKAVFIDQCFTLQHHNGPLFDKYLDVEDLPRVLEYQASSDLQALSVFCSREVRSAFVNWQLSPALPTLAYCEEPASTSLESMALLALWELGEGAPGAVACGSRL